MIALFSKVRKSYILINMENIESILTRKFPCKLKIEEGKFLKKIFEQISMRRHENSKELYYKYIYTWKDHDFVLTEEYLFRDNETVLDIKRSIGQNYYLKIQD